MKSIGMTAQGTKYRRVRTHRLDLETLYFLGLYVQFLAVLWWSSGSVASLYVAGVILFVVNATVMRFADHHSLHMTMMALATAVVLDTGCLPLLLSYWLVVSPAPLLLHLPGRGVARDVVPVYAPFALTRLRRAMEEFLAPVPAGARVLMAFDDPNGAYEEIFDGQRNLIELPLFVGMRQGVHIMPDWWAVFETNYVGAPEFWGRTVADVRRNLDQWQARFAIVYAAEGMSLDPQWAAAGFAVRSRFAWGEFGDELRDDRMYYARRPTWWLLQGPEDRHG
jgi:hypothetical protein